MPFLFLTAGMAAAEPVAIESGNLRDLLEGFHIPDAASADKYRLPTAPELASFRTALGHVLNGDLAAAAAEAAGANYDVVEYTDNVSNDVFALLREKDTNPHWGGLYVIDLSPERALVVECPHPLYDGARVPSIDVFIQTEATAFLLAGTHRNNSPVESNCDGDLGGNPYRISDMAHAPDSFFQAAHETIEQHFTRTVSLSFHGMAEDSDPADVVVSNGTPDVFNGNSLSRALATRMNEILAEAADPRLTVSHQEPGEDPALSGSTNTQGRATNGSPDPCGVEAAAAIFPERFIHMECDPDVRTGNPADWAFVIQALNDHIPLFADPEPELPTGRLVITEMMADPQQVGDTTGEYLELFNQTANPIDMAGWRIIDRGGNVATFSGIVAPGDLFVVGVSGDLNGGGNPGGVPDAVWSDQSGDLTLTNSGDIIGILDANGDLVASTAYEGSVIVSGTSREILIANSHPSGQTDDTRYSASGTAFGTDLGSPGTRGSSAFPLVVPAVGISTTEAPAEVSFDFATRPAVTYSLWKSPDLDAWSQVEDLEPLIGDGESGAFVVPMPVDDRFFYQIHLRYAAQP